jgi:hypothetical protein
MRNHGNVLAEGEEEEGGGEGFFAEKRVCNLSSVNIVTYSGFV